MRKIVRLTESDLTRIVRRVLSEEKNNINEDDLPVGVITVSNPKLVLKATGGLLNDGDGGLGCVRVEAPWPFGTFAAGIDRLKMNSDGSANITPSQSSVGSITVPKSELLKLANAWNNNQMYTINKSGSTIKIGKGLVNWCRQQWKS
jgi:hypothetical protein